MKLASIAAASLIGASAEASPAVRSIPLPSGADTLIVPADAPMRYRNTEKDWPKIHFTGRFVLTGEFHYGCFGSDDEGDCRSLYIVPDHGDQVRLPHWARRTGEIDVGITSDRRLARAVLGRRSLSLPRAREGAEVTGRISIVAKDFVAEIVCDAPSYGADFVALVKPVRLTANARAAQGGC